MKIKYIVTSIFIMVSLFIYSQDGLKEFHKWAETPPMMYGGDLMMMRPNELLLLSNKEAMQVNQSSLNNHQLFRKENKVAWVADVPGTNDKYLAVFNLGDNGKMPIEVALQDLGINRNVEIRDLWKQEDIGSFKEEFSPKIESHGSGLYRIIVK